MDDEQMKTAADVSDALQRAEGATQLGEVWGAAMGGWLAVLDASPERDSEIGRELFNLAMVGVVPSPEALADMYSFWDSIDLAKSGGYGSVEAERAKLREFLARWSRGGETPALRLTLVSDGTSRRG